MRWFLVAVVVVAACKSKQDAPAKATEGSAAPVTAGDAAPAPPPADAALPDATSDAAAPIDAGVAITPSACPKLPDAMSWWQDEIAPACAGQPFIEHLIEIDAPNLCSGACKPCKVIKDKRESVISYDDKGRFVGAAPTFGPDAKDSCTYDDKGRASCTRDFGKGKVTTMTVKRDDHGRIVEITDGKDVSTFKYDDAGRVIGATGFDTTYTILWDKDGHLMRFDDPSTSKSTFKYSGQGQLTQMKGPTGTTSYTYKDGKLVSMVKKEGEDSEMSSVQTTTFTFAYDGSGRPTSITKKYESDEPEVTTFVYDCK